MIWLLIRQYERIAMISVCSASGNVLSSRVSCWGISDDEQRKQMVKKDMIDALKC